MIGDPQPFPGDPGRGYSRRSFLKLGLGTAALSLASVDALNAAVYERVAHLNRLLPDQESPDGAFWEALRKHYLFQDGLIMMNNGTVGPMPEPVMNTLTSSFQIQCTMPCEVYNTFGARREEVRNKVARFVGATPEEIVLTRNTTEGMNFVANGLELEPGDEILMSDMEHPAGIHPWGLKAARYGVVVKEVPLGLPPASVDEVGRDLIWRLIESRATAGATVMVATHDPGGSRPGFNCCASRRVLCLRDGGLDRCEL